MLDTRDIFQSVAALHGFEPWETPVLEEQDLFRHVGEESDIVTKEMFSFATKGGQQVCLRPEGTARELPCAWAFRPGRWLSCREDAAIARAAVSSGALARTAGPLRASYFGPMFRYERPQRGRFRQFYQCGVEQLGDASVLADADVIGMAHRFLQRCGVDLIPGMDLVMLVNSLGGAESRRRYEEQLASYLCGHRASLSSESQGRLDRGSVLRVLDSKHPQDQEVVASAPSAVDSLTVECASRQSALERMLGLVGVPFVLDHRLVRGLDYYNHVVFEFVLGRPGAWREQVEGHVGTVLAGGRYDGLVGSLGGGDAPAVGWAAGVDRIVALTEDQGGADPRLENAVEIVPLTSESPAWVDEHVAVVARRLRSRLPPGHSVTVQTTPRSAKKQVGAAAKRGVPCVLFVGLDEVGANSVTVRCMGSRREWLVPLGARDSVAVEGSELVGRVVRALSSEYT